MSGPAAAPGPPTRARRLLRRNLRVDAVDVDSLLSPHEPGADVPEQPEHDGAADPVDDVLLRLQAEERVVEERPVQEDRHEDRSDTGDHDEWDACDLPVRH